MKFLSSVFLIGWRENFVSSRKVNVYVWEKGGGGGGWVCGVYIKRVFCGDEGNPNVPPLCSTVYHDNNDIKSFEPYRSILFYH